MPQQLENGIQKRINCSLLDVMIVVYTFTTLAARSTKSASGRIGWVLQIFVGIRDKTMLLLRIKMDHFK